MSGDPTPYHPFAPRSPSANAVAPVLARIGTIDRAKVSRKPV